MRCGFCATENGRNSIICNAHNVSGNKPDVGIAIFPGGSPGKSRILNRDRPRYRGENTGGGGGGEKKPNIKRTAAFLGREPRAERVVLGEFPQDVKHIPKRTKSFG